MSLRQHDERAIFPVPLSCYDLLSITDDSMHVTFLCSAPLIFISLFSPPPPSFHVLAILLLFYHPNTAPPPTTRLPTGTAHPLLPASIPTHPRCLVCTSFSASLPFHSQFLFRSVCLFISDLRPTSLYTTGILFSFSIFLSFSARYAALILACRVARLHPHFVTLSQCIAPYVIGHFARSHRTSESCHF